MEWVCRGCVVSYERVCERVCYERVSYERVSYERVCYVRVSCERVSYERVRYKRVCCCDHLWISLDRKPNTGPSLMDCCLINPSPIPDCCLNPSPTPEGGRRRPVPLLSIDRSDGPRCNNIPPLGGRLEADGGINADEEVTEPLSDFSDNAIPEDIRMVEEAEEVDLYRGDNTGEDDTAAV